MSKQQAQALVADSQNAINAADSGNAINATGSGNAFLQPKAVAQTIDALNSPAISIQKRGDLLTILDDGITDLESLMDDAFEEEGISGGKNTSGGKSASGNKNTSDGKIAKKDKDAKSSSGTNTRNKKKQTAANAALAGANGILQGNAMSQASASINGMNPTVNTTGANVTPESNVDYSTGDPAPQEEQSKEAEPNYNYYEPTEPNGVPLPEQTVVFVPESPKEPIPTPTMPMNFE